MSTHKVQLTVTVDLEAYAKEYSTQPTSWGAGRHATALIVDAAEERLKSEGGWATIADEVRVTVAKVPTC